MHWNLHNWPETLLRLTWRRIDATDSWQTFQATRTQPVCGDAVESISKNPKRAPLIAEGVTRTLTDLIGNRDTTHKQSVRRPNEILEFEFDDSDRIICDRLLQPASISRSAAQARPAKVEYFTGRTFLAAQRIRGVISVPQCIGSALFFS